MLHALFAILKNIFRILFAPLLLLRKARACPRGGWVQLVVDGPVLEMHRPRSRLPWAPKPHGLALDRLHLLVDAILADPRPVGLVVSLKRMAASRAHVTALRNELARLRAGGKDVVVHLPVGGSSAELLVASAASRILLGAETLLGPLGFRSGAMYLRTALDRAGLVPDVLAEGQYKTAGETLSRDSMSEPQKEQLGRILDVLHEELVSALAASRRVDRETVIGWIDRGLVDAEQALSLGIADAVVHDDELAKALAPAGGDEAKLAPAARYLRRRETKVVAPLVPKPRIAIVELHGPIVDHVPVRLGTVCDADRTVALLDVAARSPAIAGVVVHVDSPGGSVLASEKIHRAIRKLAEKKPVVASFGGVAASGGYYVASAAHAILAHDTTITGSIGVVAARVVAGPLLEKLGVHTEILARGAHADMLNITRPFEGEERRIFESELDRAYRRFLALVAEGRRRTPEEIAPLAGGRVWMGRDAATHGLVDKLGTLNDAIAEVRARGDGRAKRAAPMLLAPKTPLRAPVRFPLVPAGDLLGLGPLVDAAKLLLGTRTSVWAFWTGWLGF